MSIRGFRQRRWAGAGLLVLACALELGSESVSLTTYYPAPSGVYAKLIATSNVYLARDGGNVGIATTSPAEKLHVVGFVGASSYTVGGITSVFIATAANANNFGFFTGSAQRATITATGRVALGNTSPSGLNFLLDVGADAPTSAMRIRRTDCALYRFRGDQTCAQADANPPGGPVAGPACNVDGNCYVTTIAGVMSEYATPAHEVLIGDINPNGDGNMLCCPCGGACPTN